MNRRNTVSVTPAIGARTVAGRTITAPIRNSAGTRTLSGIVCSTGLSQFFFTVNPRPAIRNPRDFDAKAPAPNKREPPPQRRLYRYALRLNLLGDCLSLFGFGFIGLGVLPAEPLHAPSSVNQPLLAGKERMASRTDFHVNVALVG